jgi:quercetin dioxygenase-like cupin family protein
MICTSFAKGQSTVEKGGFESVVKIEQIISGHLKELNGKYKLRVTQTTYSSGGYIGEHHHVGPGIRYVVTGQLTYVQADTTRIFKTGDYFYESGDISHTAYNKTDKPIVILNFEILPSDWKGASPVPVNKMGHH